MLRGIVVQQFIKLCHSLKFQVEDGVWSHIVWHKEIKIPLKLSMTYSSSE